MRNISALLSLFGLLSLGATAQAASFQGHTEFTAIPLEGRILVYCDQGQDHTSTYYNCSDAILSPAESMYFTADNQMAVDADKISLKCTWADGTVRNKESGWNMAQGRSAERFNLWIETLFQRALFDVGMNKVEYSFSKIGAVTMQGELNVPVNVGETRYCYQRTYYSSNLTDCRVPGTLCSQYFYEENDCAD